MYFDENHFFRKFITSRGAMHFSLFYSLTIFHFLSLFLSKLLSVLTLPLRYIIVAILVHLERYSHYSQQLDLDDSNTNRISVIVFRKPTFNCQNILYLAFNCRPSLLRPMKSKYKVAYPLPYSVNLLNPFFYQI